MLHFLISGPSQTYEKKVSQFAKSHFFIIISNYSFVLNLLVNPLELLIRIGDEHVALLVEAYAVPRTSFG